MENWRREVARFNEREDAREDGDADLRRTVTSQWFSQASISSYDRERIKAHTAPTLPTQADSAPHQQSRPRPPHSTMILLPRSVFAACCVVGVLVLTVLFPFRWRPQSLSTSASYRRGGATGSASANHCPTSSALPTRGPGDGVCAPFQEAWLARIRRALRPWHAACGTGGTHSGVSHACPFTLPFFRELNATGVNVNKTFPHLRSHAVSIFLHNGTVRAMVSPWEVPSLDRWAREMMRLLLDALDPTWDAEGAPAVPDASMGFIINTYNIPLAFFQYYPEGPVPLLSVAAEFGTAWDVPVPGAHMFNARQMLAQLDVPSLHPYNCTSSAASGGSPADARTPWDCRVAKAVFRGAPSCSVVDLERRKAGDCSRVKAWQLGQAHPALLDVGLTGTDGGVGIEAALASVTPVPFQSIATHVDYKFALALDGMTYSRRLAELLATGAAVLLQNSRFEEFFFGPAFVPGQHFLAFDCNASYCPLPQLVSQLRANDCIAREIGAAGTRFLRTYLSPAGTACYWRLLLRELVPFFAFEAGASAALAATLPQLVPSGATDIILSVTTV